jgi:hypothetical protein
MSIFAEEDSLTVSRVAYFDALMATADGLRFESATGQRSGPPRRCKLVPRRATFLDGFLPPRRHVRRSISTCPAASTALL